MGPRRQTGAGRVDPSADRLLVVGRHEVVAALESRARCEEVLLREGVHGPEIERIRELAAARALPCRTLPVAGFEERVPGASTAQGAAARTSPSAT